MSDGKESRDLTVPTAAGIYGLVVTASVLAAAGGSLRTAPLTIAVVATLIIYWMVELYAELLQLLSRGGVPTVGQLMTALRGKWALVSASYIPLAAMLVARLLGAETSTAALIALFVVLGMLMLYGWLSARRAGLSPAAQLGLTCLAGALGLLMVLLKLVLGHVH